MAVTRVPPAARPRAPAARRRSSLGVWAPVLAVAVVGAAVLAARPATADMAAQTFRGWLWEEHGFTIWNTQWYGGHHVPAYSLLFPPLAGWIGPYLTGALAGCAAVAAFIAVAGERPGARAAVWLFASGVAANVVIGRMPFTLGVALAMAAWACATGGSARSGMRLAGAALLSLAAVWASPVAGAFLAIAAGGLVLRPRPFPGARRGFRPPVVASSDLRATNDPPGFAGRALRRASPASLVVPAVAGGLMVALLFPEGGTERFVGTAFWPMLGAVVLAGALLDRSLWLGVALYGALLVVAFVVPDPVGQNATRLGVLLGPALLALAPAPWAPRALLAVVVAGLVYLQWLPAYRAVREASGDPAAQVDFYDELRAVVEPRLRPGERVEVVFTRNHWEAAHLASHVPLARGWERQLDRRTNPLFYAPGLPASAYAGWLRANAVRFVALPSAPLDLSAHAEAKLVAAAPAFLEPIHASRRWRIYAVRDPGPAVTGPARLLSAGPDALTLQASGPGAVDLVERFSPWWRVAAGAACVSEGPGGRVRLRVQAAGRIELRAALRGDTCQ